MSTTGTLEALARQVGRVFAPLKDFDAHTASVVAIEIGVSIPPAVLSSASFTAALSATASAGGQLPDIIDQLTAAIDSGDESQTISTAVQLIAAVGTVIGSLADIEAQLPASNFTEHLIDYLVIRLVEYRTPLLSEILTILGVIDRTHIPGVLSDPNKLPTIQRTLHLDRLGTLLHDPLGLMQTVYGWNGPGFDGVTLIQRLGDVLTDAPYPNTVTTAADGTALLTSEYFDLGVDKSVSPAGISLTIHTPLAAGVDFKLPLANPVWTVDFVTQATLLAETVVKVRPPANASAQAPSGSLSGSFTISVNGAPVTPADALVIVGQTSGSRLQAQTLSAGVGLTFAASTGGAVSVAPLLSLAAKGGKLIIDTSSADSFLGSLLSGVQLAGDFDLSATWQPSTGLQLHGSAGVELTIALSLSLGPIEIDTLYIVLSIDDSGALTLELSFAAEGTLGPISAAIDRLGATAQLTFPSGGKGNLGPANLAIAFKPPSGLGISVDAGPVSGGGYIYFDPPNGRYAGVLSLSIYSIQVTAIGLLDTKLPNGDSGYSFLIIISIEFTPIQLGFGFTLNGVGGLCGINRDFVSEALQSGLRAHSLDHILFPKDPIANAPAIISDLRTIFPPAEGRYVFGPMVELGWGGGLNLVTAELGILLALPSPIVIAILGQLNVTLPTADAAIVELHLDVLGIIDFGKKLFSLDATLHDSRVVVFTIYGDMAMRLSWGDNPSFALSIGGLNPHFQPPDNFPQLKRLTIALSASDALRLSIQSYFAITSNSFQFGAKCELYAGVSAFNVYGWLGFDALFIFSPFSFIIDFTAGLALRSGTSTLMGISVDGELSGPTPWHVSGDAHVSILFFSISVHVDITWGDNKQVSAPPVDAWPQLQAALQNVQNWSGSLPAGIPTPVTLSTPKADPTQIYVDPNGVLTLRERVLPLNQTLTKFGEAVPGPQTTFTLSQVQLGGQSLPFSLLTDKFAPAQFEQMSDQDKLSRPSFDDGVAGFTVGDGQLAFGQQFGLDLAYEDIYVDDRATLPLIKILFTPTLAQQLAWALSSGAAKSALKVAGMAKFTPPTTVAPLVTLGNEQFVVATTSDLTQRADITTPVSKGEAYRALSAHLANNPSEQGQLQVVPLHELAA